MASNLLHFIPLPNKPPNQVQDWQSTKTAIAEALLREMHGVQQYAKEKEVTRQDSIYTGLSGAVIIADPSWIRSSLEISITSVQVSRSCNITSPK